MKLLLTGAISYTKKQIEILESYGYEAIYIQDERKSLESQMDPEMKLKIEGIVCNGLFLYHDISEFPNLKVIQLTSAGMDRVPLDYIEEHGIEIYNARGVYSIPMAEWVLAGVLELYKQSAFFRKNQKEKMWIKNREIWELAGKKAVIVGFGSVGREIARRMKSFQVRICSVDIVPFQQEADENYSLEQLDSCIEWADILILTVPFTKDTKGLLNRERISKLKKSAVVVNVARGGIMDETALTEALKNKEIAGAVLDVFEKEPLEGESALWNCENVLISPHNSFVSEKNQERLFKVISENLLRYKRKGMV